MKRSGRASSGLGKENIRPGAKPGLRGEETGYLEVKRTQKVK